MSYMLFLCVAPCAQAQTALICAEKPQILQISEQFRAAYRTAQVDWCVRYEDESENRYYSNQYANGDLLYVDRGNIRGQTTIGKDRTGEPYAFSELRALCKEERVWSYTEDSLACSVEDHCADSYPISDIGVLGFRDIDAISEGPGRYISDEAKVTQYEVREIDGLYEISAHCGVVEPYKQVWLLDPERDFQPIRCSRLVGGVEIAACETSYQEIDGRWFPSEAVFSVQGVLRSRTTIISATFDEPWHDADLAPDDLGILAGMEVVEAGQPLRFWDGREAISQESFFARHRKGDIDTSAIQNLIQRHRTGAAPGRFSKMSDEEWFGLGLEISKQPARWEAYVRRFIGFYRLDSGQAKDAWKLHAKSLKMVSEFDVRHEQEVKELSDRIGKLKQKSKRTDAEQQEIVAKLRRIEEIRAHTQRVFDESLQPGLLKLPTKAQVEAARAFAKTLSGKTGDHGERGSSDWTQIKRK
ncbi:MAG: hypothetical protein KJ057_16200 [Phycisphaerae bacterium]|nr:MAG: hypothetical protein F9K17_09795 [Phycisphaerae bacterium]MBE7456914.1 hypothetical protein [Planctomycetia bacterium]MCK6466265.1 hemolysin XhlA family protein [Phycisphaerae bacterium]MCL4720014.1 hypothetical protein [Phycisphaerae bacterium]NUQ09984.1 hypothetical protein [Phycisphaerae bacterium]